MISNREIEVLKSVLVSLEEATIAPDSHDFGVGYETAVKRLKQNVRDVKALLEQHENRKKMKEQNQQHKPVPFQADRRKDGWM